MERQPEYWIQEAQGSDPADPASHWSTVRIVFEDRADAEASVERVQARRPVRVRWPLGHFHLPEMPARPRNKVAPLWWLRWALEGLPFEGLPSRMREEWERSSAFQSIDFADLPEACLVPVHVVYRVVSADDLRAQGEDPWGRQNNSHEVGQDELTEGGLDEADFGFFVRLYSLGERMTDREIDARFSDLFPLEW